MRSLGENLEVKTIKTWQFLNPLISIPMHNHSIANYPLCSNSNSVWKNAKTPSFSFHSNYIATIYCQLRDTHNLRGNREVGENSVSVGAGDMGLLWGFGTFDTLHCRLGSGFVFFCSPRLLKSVAEQTKSHQGHTKLFPLCHTLASHLPLCLSCFFPSVLDLFLFCLF